jgi:hypothetical protein
MLGTADHDLVVEKKSSVPEFFPPGESVTCSHFEYFSPSHATEEQFRRVITAVRQALGFEQAQAERLNQILAATSKPVDLSKPVVLKKTKSSSS